MNYVGKHTILKSVSIEDAADICALRNKPSNNKYLSSSNPITLEQQEAWIKKYLLEPDGVYFLITDNFLSPVGTISLYNQVNGCAEFGRYICENPLQAIEAEFLLLKYAFEELNLNTIYCKTVRENQKVWKQHSRFGFIEKGLETDTRINKEVVIQSINKEQFQSFDYSQITKLLNRF